jgi:hypothetical protein
MIAVTVTGVLLLGGLLAWNAARRTDNPTVAAVAGKDEKVLQPVHNPPQAQPQADARQPIDKPDNRPIVQGQPEEPAANIEPVMPSSPIAPNPPDESAIAKAEVALARPTFEKPTEAAEKPTKAGEKPAVPSFQPLGRPASR